MSEQKPSSTFYQQATDLFGEMFDEIQQVSQPQKIQAQNQYQWFQQTCVDLQAKIGSFWNRPPSVETLGLEPFPPTGDE